MQIKFKCDKCGKRFIIDDGAWQEVDYSVDPCPKCILWGDKNINNEKYGVQNKKEEKIKTIDTNK